MTTHFMSKVIAQIILSILFNNTRFNKMHTQILQDNIHTVTLQRQFKNILYQPILHTYTYTYIHAYYNNISIVLKYIFYIFKLSFSLLNKNNAKYFKRYHFTNIPTNLYLPNIKIKQLSRKNITDSF